MPDLDTADERLYTIPGSPPNLLNEKPGDAFAPRNQFALEIDDKADPPIFQVTDTHYAATRIDLKTYVFHRMHGIIITYLKILFQAFHGKKRLTVFIHRHRSLPPSSFAQYALLIQAASLPSVPADLTAR